MNAPLHGYIVTLACGEHMWADARTAADLVILSSSFVCPVHHVGPAEDAVQQAWLERDAERQARAAKRAATLASKRRGRAR